MAGEAVPRIRRGTIPAEAVLVVRGDDPMAALAADARRFLRRFPDWNRFGVSAFVARDADEVDALCETRLAPWLTVRVFRRAVVEAAGVEVVPRFAPRTSRSPTPTSTSSSTDSPDVNTRFSTTRTMR